MENMSKYKTCSCVKKADVVDHFCFVCREKVEWREYAILFKEPPWEGWKVKDQEKKYGPLNKLFCHINCVPKIQEMVDKEIMKRTSERV